MRKYFPFILTVCLVAASVFLATEQAFAQAADGNPPAVTGITPGRGQALAGALVALVSLIMGWRAKGREYPARRTQAIIALSLGGIAIILSVIHLGTSAGAVFGSGSGKAGAIVSLVLAVAGVTLSGLALRPKKA